MSDNQNENFLEMPDELILLKQRADLLGLSYHPSIGLEKLRDKVNAALSAQEETKPEEVAQDPVTETLDQKLRRLRDEAAKLVRIRVTCMNPNKKEWEGEIITAGNAGVGTYKKYIPFNADEGWHVPNILYQVLKSRECQVFHTVTGPRGNKFRKGKLIKEFAIEVLPPLTEEELKDLAQRQAMSKSVD